MKQITLNVCIILITLSLLALGIVSLVGCGGSNPTDDSAAITDTENAFWKAYNAQDYNTCLNYVETSAKQTMISELQMANSFTGAVTVNSVSDIVVTGSTATASVTLTRTNPDINGSYTSTQIVNFQNDGGTWKLIPD